MISFFTRRLLHSVLLLWGVLTLTFGALHIAPGDPFDLMISPETPPEYLEAMRELYGLDAPLHQQYWRWINGVVRGDLGLSLRLQRPVRDVLADALPYTLLLSSLSMLVHFLVGTVLGVVSAARRASKLDRTATIVSVAIYSLPVFWFALMMQLLFSYLLRWFPSGGVGDVPFGWDNLGPWFLSMARHLFLPVLVLGTAGAASVARFMRASVIDALHQDYVRTAYGKGLPERLVVWKHVFRNASIPLITLVGLSFPFLLSGSIVVETIFSWPGLGRVMVEAIQARDYPVILASTMLTGSLVVLGSLIADVSYALVDPRIRAR